MAFVDDTQRAELLAKANEAIATTDGARANELYRDIVQTITIVCNKNQKEIANELQQLAKSIDEQGKPTEAFEFKQRTCAVMLEISMEDRRRMKLEGAGGGAFGGGGAAGSTAASASGSAPYGSASSGSASSGPSGSNAAGSSSTGGNAPGSNTAGANAPGAAPSGAPGSNLSNTIPPTNRPGSGMIGTNTSTTVPSTTSAQSGHSTGASSAQSNFAPKMPEPTRSRLIGVDTREIEPISIDAQLHTDYPSGSVSLQSSATAIDTALPFVAVEYLYMGSSDYDRDLTYYREVLGAQEVWKFDRFGSKITAFSLSAGPLILISDSRQAPSCQPVFRVSDLASCARDLTSRGWKPVAGPFGTPNGEAYSFEDPSGNRFAIFQVDETSTDRAYFDPTEGE